MSSQTRYHYKAPFYRRYKAMLIVTLCTVFLSGCAALAVVDTAVTVTSVAVKTTAKVAGAVVGGTVDGIRAITKKSNSK